MLVSQLVNHDDFISFKKKSNVLKVIYKQHFLVQFKTLLKIKLLYNILKFMFHIVQNLFMHKNSLFRISIKLQRKTVTLNMFAIYLFKF